MAVSGVIEHIELDKGLYMVDKAGVGGKNECQKWFSNESNKQTRYKEKMLKLVYLNSGIFFHFWAALARLCHDWLDCFMLLKLGVMEVCALDVRLVQTCSYGVGWRCVNIGSGHEPSFLCHDIATSYRLIVMVMLWQKPGNAFYMTLHNLQPLLMSILAMWGCMLHHTDRDIFNLWWWHCSNHRVKLELTKTPTYSNVLHVQKHRELCQRYYVLFNASF